MRRFAAVAVSVLLFSASASALADGFTIADKGVSTAVVVVSDDATEPEKHAAAELAAFLAQITGAEFAALNRYDGEKHRLLVGIGAARLADKALSIEGLGKEGIIIRTIGEDLVLAGGRPRGTLYAVYTFLEDVVGCRWWTAAASRIPRKPTLDVPPLSIRYVPVFEYREPYWNGYWNGWDDADWAVRNKHNGGRAKLDAKRGGKIDEIGPCHSFEHYLSPKKYFEAHPEWFSEIDGKRTGDSSQLCLTNKEMLAEFIKNVKADVRERYSPDHSVWVTQNDWGGYCRCKACTEVNDREESPAGTMVYFANAVAAGIAGEFPGMAVRTFAYNWSQKPPRHAKASRDVIVQLCTTDCSYSRPYTHEQNRQFRERIEAWSKICDRIYIWDYLVNFANYVCPHPNLRTLGPNVKCFADNNVKGVFGQGAWEGDANGTEIAELRKWVLCKLYWDPSRDGQELIDEFLHGYYGPAAPHIRACLDISHDAAEASGAPLGMMQSPFSDDYLSFETMCKCLEHMRAAEAAAAGDGALAARVEIATLPVLYVFLMRWDEFQETARAGGVKWPLGTEIGPVYEDFEAARERHGVKHMSEKNARGQWPSVAERVQGGLPLVPPGCEEHSRAHWVDLQDGGFNRNTYVTSVVKDELASDGSATRLPASSSGGQKLLTRQLWRVPLASRAADAKQPLRAFLSIRCKLTGKEGVAFKCGVDGKHRDLVVRCADVPDGGYHTYDLGVYDSLEGWINLWVTPGDNPENVEAMWVDRAWLVQEASHVGAAEAYAE